MKRALVLCSGGSRGAYEAGVVRHLVGDLSIRYDVICGAGMGGFNALFLNTYQAGDELLAAASLCKVWSTFLEFPRSPADRLSLLRGKITEYGLAASHYLGTDPPMSRDRQVMVGAANVTVGQYHFFDQADQNLGLVAAASCTPACAVPVLIGKHMWCDSGTRERTPFRAAIDAGAERVDVVLSTPESHGLPPGSVPGFDSFFVMADELVAHDIATYVRSGGKASVTVIRPVTLPHPSGTEFHSRVLTSNMRQGFDDARRIVPVSAPSPRVPRTGS